jgi:hypothetical protein
MIITLRWNEAAGSPGILWRIGMTGAGGMPTHLRRPHPSQGQGEQGNQHDHGFAMGKKCFWDSTIGGGWWGVAGSARTGMSGLRWLSCFRLCGLAGFGTMWGKKRLLLAGGGVGIPRLRNEGGVGIPRLRNEFSRQWSRCFVFSKQLL